MKRKIKVTLVLAATSLVVLAAPVAEALAGHMRGHG